MWPFAPFLAGRVKRFRRYLSDVWESLNESRHSWQAKIQWWTKRLDYRMILVIILLLIFILFLLTSWPWVTDTILGIVDLESLSEWNLSLPSIIGIGGITGFITSCLTHSRNESLRMQTNTNVFTKSIELLGRKEAALRQGGIYSLGGIAKDNRNLHPTIMRIMTSYIQEKTYNMGRLFKISSSQRMSLDVKAAIDVLKDRRINYDQPLKDDKKPSQFDLSNSCISDGDFSFIELSHTDFSDSVMSGCCFDQATLSNSSFVSSKFCKSTFIDSTLKNCEFRDTKFHGCDFKDCDLSGSKFENCNLADVRNLTQEQINSATVNQYTNLPEGISRPETS